MSHSVAIKIWTFINSECFCDWQKKKKKKFGILSGLNTLYLCPVCNYHLSFRVKILYTADKSNKTIINKTMA